jgi:hypothetical protein
MSTRSRFERWCSLVCSAGDVLVASGINGTVAGKAPRAARQ